MDLRRWPHADDLLERALALPVAERRAYVRREARGDDALVAALDAVLDEAERADPFLEPGGALTGPFFEELGRRLAPGGAGGGLPVGMLVGPYRVIEPIGRGGMGEVYRARDSKLNRDVALKILPARFAAEPDRLARFEREARVLASLNHPRIGAIYDLQHAGGVRALVLELVEGPTLAARIAEGPLPVPEAVAMAQQVAEALEAAHQRGVIHRDLKPANIKMTPGGAKVLDFGLAKAVRPDESDDGAPAGLAPDLSTAYHRPRVMGTAAYMSPEQARGVRVDHRADIWAFGCILYEMLSGSRAFAGESTTEILAQVLERDPDLSRLPKDTPPAIRRLVSRCLEKDVRRRLGWIGDAVIELEDAWRVDTEAPARPRRRWPALAALVLAAFAVGALTSALLSRGGRASPPDVTRAALPVPAGDELVTGDQPTLTVSTDGRLVVYRARRAGVVQFFARRLDRDEPAAIAGTENGMAPFLSPAGDWVGFVRDGALVKVPVGGGPAVVLCEVPSGTTAAWTPGGEIVFGAETTGGLMRVAAAGGAPSPLTRVNRDAGEVAHALPSVIPGGVLFTVWRKDGIHLAAARLDDGEPVSLGEGRQGRYLEPGYVVFLRQGALWAAPFDADRLATSGAAAPVLDAVEASAISGNAHFALSPGGRLVFLPRRGDESRARALVLVDREGGATPVPVTPRPFTRAAVSPDGSRIALSIAETDSRNIWLYTADRGTLTRLTFDAAVDTAPIWTPDGASLIFRSDRDGGGLFRVRADGADAPRRLTQTSTEIHTPYDVTRDGRTLLLTEFRTYRDQAIGAVALDGPGAIRWLVDGPFAEMRPALSPDNRWMAYQSDESGRFEVYVRPYPDVEAGRWQVSVDGGTSPRWTPDGRELLFYRDGTFLRAPVETGLTFRAGAPAPMFQLDLQSGRLGPVFDVMPDGQRLLVVRAGDGRDDPAGAHLQFVEHWSTDVAARLRPPS